MPKRVNVKKTFRPNLLVGMAMLSLALLMTVSCAGTSYTRSKLRPPKLPHEFRGVWVATLANIDWPSKPGLNSAEQKKEMIAILDRAARLKLNAVMLQVRPACDAIYPSKIEPWSEYLTGAMGKPPEPAYDPLAFAIEQAHARGLELHAWFNPYRARHYRIVSGISSNHISRTHPDLVRQYGRYLWLDPGERAVQDYSLSVVMDVVRRYDVDGVHFDDYFYPYHEKDRSGRDLDFPDDASWKKSGENGDLSRDDWRRENVNQFVERTGKAIKAAKPWVKFGISPFGIWRPHNPPQIDGLDAYQQLYADARKWLVNGWVDYLAPQLYWPIDSREQSFTALLDWWTKQNPKDCDVFAGIAASNAGKWNREEIPNQIRVTRNRSGADGYILYSANSLATNPDLEQRLRSEINTQPVLPFAAEGKGNGSPEPKVRISGVTKNRLWLSCQGTNGVATWVIQTKTGGDWRTEILRGPGISKTITGRLPEVIAVTEVDRAGNASQPVVFEKR